MLAATGLLVSAATVSAQELIPRATFTGPTLQVSRTVLSPDGKLLVFAGRNVDRTRQGRGVPRGELDLIDTATGERLAALHGTFDSPETVAFNTDGKRLAAGGDRYVQVWDVRTYQVLATFEVPRGQGQVEVAALNKDGKQLAVTFGSDQVKVWDWASGKEVVSFRHATLNHGGPGLAFNSDLGTLAVRDYQEIDLWDVATGKRRLTLSEHLGEVGCLTFSGDGRTLLAASTLYHGRRFKCQGNVKLWDVATGKERATFPGPFGRVVAAALSPDGKTVALLDSPKLHADPDLKLLNVATGRQRTIPTVPAHALLSLAFTTEGRLFVLGTPDDKTFKLWEVALGVQRTLIAPTDRKGQALPIGGKGHGSKKEHGAEKGPGKRDAKN
jgi:WD40 repeat protein